MTSSSPHRPLDQTTAEIGAETAEQLGQTTGVRITVVIQNRFLFDTSQVTGAQIKEAASIPADFALYRRAQGGNAPIPDDALLQLRNGDHFFARPPSDAASEHGGR